MHALRFLRPECVKLSLDFVPSEPRPEETPEQADIRRAKDKERLLAEFAELLGRSGQVANANKFYRDLVNRERKATTAIAPGVAIPHVRTMQVRSFVMGLARAPADGIPFASLDGEPTRLFLLLASPPYDDKVYLQVYRELAQLIQDEEAVEALFRAASVQDVFNAMRGVLDR